MPPKKAVVEEKKLKLGRPGNTLKIGIVGLPMVGKSLLFKAISKKNVAISNVLFQNKDPNIAQVNVPDPRFDKLVQVWKPKSQAQATLKIVDVSGIVQGASKGEGLGNAFLSHIGECDAIYHIVRAFEDEEVQSSENGVDPLRDLQIIYDELLLKDLETVNKYLEKLEPKITRYKDQEAEKEKEIILKVKTAIETDKKWIKDLTWNFKDIEVINKLTLLTAKQIVYLVNLSEADFIRKKNKWLLKIKDWIVNKCPGEMIPFSASFEGKLFDDSNALLAQVQTQPQEKTVEQPAKTTEEKKEGSQQSAQQTAPQTMINRIIRTGYKALDLIQYFTVGFDEIKAWTIREGFTAPQAAGVIHSDLEKGFICADCYRYDDWEKLDCQEAKVKSEGKYFQAGKEYIVRDGDIMEFKHNAQSSKGKKK